MTERALRVTRWQQFGNNALTFLRGRRLGRGAAALLCAGLIGGMALPGAASAQQGQPAPLQRATRAELTARSSEIERELVASNLKDKDKSKLRAEAALLTTRLSQGDFHPGDRFLITITQDGTTRSDTASVRDSLLVSLVGLPDVSLQGTLRSELNEKLSSHVARFLRNSSVRTIVFTRVAILGGVARPGYYVVPPDQPIGDLLMVAGGTTTDARLNDLQVKRGASTYISVKDSRKALKEGRTLEQLDVQSGDEINIPVKRKVSPQTVFQILFFVSSIFFAVVNFLKFYYGQQQP